MINYRNIFNPNYNYIGIILIIIMVIILVILTNNTRKIINSLGKILLISGILTLVISLSISFITSVVVPSTYQLFLEIITSKLQTNMLSQSLLIIAIGTLLLLIEKIFFKPKLKEVY